MILEVKGLFPNDYITRENSSRETYIGIVKASKPLILFRYRSESDLYFSHSVHKKHLWSKALYTGFNDILYWLKLLRFPIANLRQKCKLKLKSKYGIWADEIHQQSCVGSVNWAIIIHTYETSLEKYDTTFARPLKCVGLILNIVENSDYMCNNA